jgi:hypothetical protein
MYYPALLCVLYLAALWGILRKTSWFLVIAVILSVAIFLGLRGGDAGSDTVNYVSAYNALENNIGSYKQLATTFVRNNITAAEPGFIIFTYLSKLIGLSTDLYLVAVSAFGLCMMYFAYHRITTFPLLAFILYSLSMSCVALHANVIRQGMAVGFIILAIYLIQERKNKQAFLLLLIASTFHFSALLIAMFLFPAMKKVQLKYYWFALLALIILLVSGVLSNIVMAVLPSLFAAKISKYFEVGFASLATFKFISFFVFALVIEFVRKQKEVNVTQIDNLYRCYFSLFLIQVLFMGNLVASERFGLYRFALEPLIIVSFFNIFKEKYFARGILITLTFIYGAIVYNISSIKGILT